MKKVLFLAVALFTIILQASAQETKELTNEEFVGSWSGSVMGVTIFIDANADNTCIVKANLNMGNENGGIKVDFKFCNTWEIKATSILMTSDPASFEMSDPQIKLPTGIDEATKSQIDAQIKGMKSRLKQVLMEKENLNANLKIISYDGEKLIVEIDALTGGKQKLTFRKKLTN